MLRLVCVFALAWVGTIGGIAEAKRTPCPGGRFVVQGGPLPPSAPATEVSVIELGGTATARELGVGCATAVKRLRMKASKRGTKVSAISADCAGLTGKVRLQGVITDECRALAATLRAKRF